MQAWPRVLPPWDTAKVPGIPEGKWQPVTEGCCCFFDIVFLVACNKFKKFQDLDGFGRTGSTEAVLKILNWHWAYYLLFVVRRLGKPYPSGVNF